MLGVAKVSRCFMESQVVCEIRLKWLASSFMGLSTCSQTWAGLPLPWGFRCVLGEMISGHISSVPSVVARQESHLCTFRTSHWATDLLLIFTSSFKEFYKYFIIGQSKVECISKEQYYFECASLRFSCKILSMIFFFSLLWRPNSAYQYGTCTIQPCQIHCSGEKETGYLFWIAENKDNFLSKLPTFL